MIDKEYCYEYFHCQELSCSRRKDLAKNCWDFDDVECESHSEPIANLKKRFETKLEACQLCNYYQQNNAL